MIFKLCNEGNSVIGVREDGIVVSYSIEAEEYKQWLKAGNKPEPEFTNKEIISNELERKKQEASSYLDATDWVKDYKLRHDLGLELISELSSKWKIINKREEYKNFLKGLD